MHGLRQYLRGRPALKRAVRFAILAMQPAFNPILWPKYFRFFYNFWDYRKQSTRERIPWLDLYPCLQDNARQTAVDSHYFHIGAWAASRIFRTAPDSHVDIASSNQFVGMLTAFTDVVFVDIRPLNVRIPRLVQRPGSILDLPFQSSSVRSVSCLSVAEHIGLGRYGDPIDPDGTDKACLELERILAPGGNLFFAVPIGRPRVCFNAHRVFDTGQVMSLFQNLKLVEFSGVDDTGTYTENMALSDLDAAEFGCGMFWFSKP